MFALKDQDILFVGGSQGAKNKFEFIKHATKSNSDISPQATVVTVLRALAIKLGIKNIVCTSAKNQCALNKTGDFDFHASIYDALWESSGAIPMDSGDFLLPAASAEKPLTEIKQGHRIRTRRKRQFKLEIQRKATQQLDLMIS
jgi:uncharacterized protein VirK/YbjX